MAENSRSVDGAGPADELAKDAGNQIRDALATLSYASDGYYEDEAMIALDALDWLQSHVDRLQREALAARQ